MHAVNSFHQISISEDTECRALVASDNAITTNILVFFFPALITLLLLSLNIITEKTTRNPLPHAQLQLDVHTDLNSK